MRIVNLDQNGHDWYLWRAAGLGASDAPILLGVSPWKTREELWKEKRRAFFAAQTGKVLPTEETWPMRRGKDLEPAARELICNLTKLNFTPICVMHDTEDWLKASLDGYDSDADIILEIKCPNDKSHGDALAGHIPEHYYPQLVHQSLVSGCQDFLYASYSPDRKWKGRDRLALISVSIPHEPQAIYLDAAKEFWVSVISPSSSKTA